MVSPGQQWTHQWTEPPWADRVGHFLPVFSRQVRRLHVVRGQRRPGRALQTGHPTHMVRMIVRGNKLPHRFGSIPQPVQITEYLSMVKEPPSRVDHRNRRLSRFRIGRHHQECAGGQKTPLVESRNHLAHPCPRARDARPPVDPDIAHRASMLRHARRDRVSSIPTATAGRRPAAP